MDFKPFKIGKYLLLEKIATGGMAEVYRAKASGAGGFEKQLAIKRILPNYASNDEFRRMFEYEARLSSMLTHANIAQIYDFVKAGETYLLAMEFIDGKNLRQFINKAKKVNYVPPIEFGLYIINEVCKGLEYAHKRKDDLTGKPLNVIHRDMSPQNIMLSYEGSVKIVDFGIAKAKDRVDETRSGVIKGKFGYMSPEQANGEQIDHRTDIFSTGIILHELLTNKRLFAGENDMATLRQIQECVIPSASRANPKITADLEKIMMKSLTKDLTLRYQDAGLFHRNIQGYLNKYFTAFSQREMSEILMRVFADEIIAEKKRFEAVYRQSIPFSQKASGDRPDGEIDENFADNQDPDEPETKSETRNASIVTNLSGEELVTSISGVFRNGRPKSEPANPEDDNPATQVESIIPEEEADPVTRGGVDPRTGSYHPTNAEPPTTGNPTQARTGSTFGRTGSNPLIQKDERPTQVTGKKTIQEKTEVSKPEFTSGTGISLSDTGAAGKGRRRDRSVSMSRDISTSGTGQNVSLQTYGQSNQLESVIERREREKRVFSDPYVNKKKKGNPLLKFFLIILLLGMGFLYMKDRRKALQFIENIIDEKTEEPRTPATAPPPKRIRRTPQRTEVEPQVEPEVAPAAPAPQVAPDAPVTPGTVTPRAYGDCSMDIQTDPPGATIFVERDVRGVSNSVISGVCGKAYNITLQLEGYEDFKTNYVFKNSKGSIKKSLKKVPMGILQLTVNGNAELYINDTFVNDLSPGKKFEKNLRAGQRYKLRFVNKPFKIDVGCTVTIQADRVEKKIIRLSDGRCD